MNQTAVGSKSIDNVSLDYVSEDPWVLLIDIMLQLEDPVETKEAEAEKRDQGGDRDRVSRLPPLQNLFWVKMQKLKLSLLLVQVLTAIAASASLRWCRRDESSDSSTALSSSRISVWLQNQIFFVVDYKNTKTDFIISPLDASILSMTVTL